MLLLPCLDRWEAWDFCFHVYPCRWVQDFRDGNWVARQMLCGCSMLRQRGCAEVRAAAACSSPGKWINHLQYLQIWQCTVLCSTLVALCMQKTILPMWMMAWAGVKKLSRNGCGKAFHLLWRAASAAFGVGSSNLPWRGWGVLTHALPLALHSQGSSSI